MREYSIGELSEATETKVATIRYYEKIGLMAPPGRTAGNQRRYNGAHLKRLIFIRHARDFGFSHTTITELLSLSDHPDHSCAEVNRIARRHIAAIRRRIEILTAMLGELERAADCCKAHTVSDCSIIEAIANHAFYPDHDSSQIRLDDHLTT